MEIEHDNKANTTRDKCPQLVSVITTNPTTKVVCYPLMPKHECHPSGKYKKAKEK